MSAIQNSNAAALHKIIATAQAALADLGIDTTKTKTKTTKGGKAEKTEKVKKTGQMNAYTAYSLHVYSTHAAEVAVWKAEQEAAGEPKTKQTMPCFMSAWRKTHEDDYKAFAAEWKESHPKSSATSAAASVADDTSVNGDTSIADDASVVPDAKPKKAGRKKIADMTAEEKAVHDAKTAARKAAKAEKKAAEEVEASTEVAVTAPEPVVVVVAAPVAVPVAAPEAAAESDDEDEAVLKLFKQDGVKYLRLCSSEGEWLSGDLWLSNKGAKGDYYGCLQDDGSIDTDAEAPMLT